MEKYSEHYAKIERNPFNYTKEELNEAEFILKKGKITWIDQALSRTCKLFDNYLNINNDLSNDPSYTNLKKINTFLYTLASGNKPLTRANYNKVNELITRTRAKVAVNAMFEQKESDLAFSDEVGCYCECVMQCLYLKRLEALQKEVMNSIELTSEPMISRLAELTADLLKEPHPDHKKVEAFTDALRKCQRNDPEERTQDYHIELFREYARMCELYRRILHNYTQVSRRG